MEQRFLLIMESVLDDSWHLKVACLDFVSETSHVSFMVRRVCLGVENTCRLCNVPAMLQECGGDHSPDFRILVERRGVCLQRHELGLYVYQHIAEIPGGIVTVYFTGAVEVRVVCYAYMRIPVWLNTDARLTVVHSCSIAYTKLSCVDLVASVFGAYVNEIKNHNFFYLYF